MFNDELSMKNALIQSIDLLKEKMSRIFGEDTEFVYVGDEIQIPTGRIDMLFYSVYFDVIDSIRIPNIEFYVIELKNRHGVAKDISQIARYSNGIRSIANKFFPNDSISINGLLVCTKQSCELQEITMSDFLSDFYVLELKHLVDVKWANYTHSDNFMDSITTVGKIQKIMKDVLEDKK